MPPRIDLFNSAADIEFFISAVVLDGRRQRHALGTLAARNLPQLGIGMCYMTAMMIAGQPHMSYHFSNTLSADGVNVNHLDDRFRR